MPDHYRNAKSPTWWSSQSEAAWHFLFDLVMLANSRILFKAAFALFDICRISRISSSIDVILGIFSVVSIEMSPRFTNVLLLGLFWLKHVMIFQQTALNLHLVISYTGGESSLPAQSFFLPEMNTPGGARKVEGTEDFFLSYNKGYFPFLALKCQSE